MDKFILFIFYVYSLLFLRVSNYQGFHVKCLLEIHFVMTLQSYLHIVKESKPKTTLLVYNDIKVLNGLYQR